MTLQKTENIIIQLLLKEPQYTIEEIQYILNKEHQTNLTTNELTHWITLVQKKVKLEKSITKKQTTKTTNELINNMNNIIKQLKKILNNINQQEQPNNKTILNTIKEIRLTLMDTAILTKNIQETTNEKINKYYIPISKINEYIKKNSKI